MKRLTLLFAAVSLAACSLYQPAAADAALGPCCWLGLCCPPRAAAEALAAHLGLPASEAPAMAAVLRDFALVPRTVQPVRENGDPVPVYPENQRLKLLLGIVHSELQAVLHETGHPLP